MNQFSHEKIHKQFNTHTHKKLPGIHRLRTDTQP